MKPGADDHTVGGTQVSPPGPRQPIGIRTPEGLSFAQITHPGGLLPGLAPARLQHGSGPPPLLQALREIGRPRGGAAPPSLGKKRGTIPRSGSWPPPFYIITPGAQAPRHPSTCVHACMCDHTNPMYMSAHVFPCDQPNPMYMHVHIYPCDLPHPMYMCVHIYPCDHPNSMYMCTRDHPNPVYMCTHMPV